MDNMDKLSTIAKIMNEMSPIVAQIGDIEQRREAIRNLWELAIKDGDGVKEHELREQIHALVDQGLDVRARALQLVKTLQSL
jgi:hypothetical protein